MSNVVMVTGTGRSYALGYNIALRYLEAGSIEKCYRTTGMDYGMGKAALNMATMYLYNTFKDEGKVNIFAVHPGWIHHQRRR